MSELETDLRESYGIVAMLDALGVRNATVEESMSFINAFRKIEMDTPEFAKSFLSVAGFDPVALYQDKGFYTYAFGDTIILLWQVPKKDGLKVLLITGIVLSIMIINGLDMGLRLRGAVSIGKVVPRESSKRNINILGPAVTDVASWYEASELIGVVATPNCGQHLNYLQMNPNMAITPKGESIPLDSCFRKYDVPLKGNSSRNLWVVSWPQYITDCVS